MSFFKNALDNIGGFFKGASTRSFAFKNAEEADGFVKMVNRVTPTDVERVGTKVVLDTSGMSATARRNIDEIKRLYKADMVVDGGTTAGGGVTWKKVLFVAGGVIVVIILIDPETGNLIGKKVADAGVNLVEPFIPSILSVMIPCCLLVSSALAAFGIMQRMR